MNIFQVLQLLQVEVLKEILSVAGLVAFLEAIVILALWREKNEYKKSLAALNEVVRKDGIENTKIIEGLTNIVENKFSNDKDILSTVLEIKAILKTKIPGDG